MLGWPWFRFDGSFCSEAKGSDCKGTPCENSWTKTLAQELITITQPGILHQNYMSRQASKFTYFTKASIQPDFTTMMVSVIVFARFPTSHIVFILQSKIVVKIQISLSKGSQMLILKRCQELQFFSAIKSTEELQFCGACESLAMALEKFPEMWTTLDIGLGSDFAMIETKLRKIGRKHSKVPTIALAPDPTETRSQHFCFTLNVWVERKVLFCSLLQDRSYQ